MREMLFSVIVACVLFSGSLVLPSSIAQGDGGFETENVIVVFIDGARYTETFGNDTHELIPHIWNELRPNGSIDTGFYNKGETRTISSHGSAMSGIWLSLYNDGTENPSYPTIFEVYRKTCGLSKSDVWVVAGKDKIEAVTYSTKDGYGLPYRADFKGPEPQYIDDYNDTSTWADVQGVMDAYHPSLLMINLAEVDGDGHSGNWTNYVGAIRAADLIVWQLWSKVQSDPAYKDKTTLIVTNDHGRHTDDWTSHGHSGENCDGCEHVMLLAIGPDIKKGVQLDSGSNLRDITPTVAALLGFDMTANHGELLTGLLTHIPTDGTDDTIDDSSTGEETSSVFMPLLLGGVGAVIAVAVLAVVMRGKRGQRGDQAQGGSPPAG